MPGKKYDILFTEEDKEKMKAEYIAGASIRDIQDRYGIKCRNWVKYNLLNGLTRDFSKSTKLAHEKYPERFKHDEAYKEKMRKFRLRYMKEHPEKTAWRKRNEPSYPEKCFIKFLEDNGYDKKYCIEREYPVFPYYIDFAFVDLKVAVEIDGSQHVLDEGRIVRDEDKDKTLTSTGWKVLRVTENLVKTDWTTLKHKLDEVIVNGTIKVDKVGIFLAKKPREKVKRGADGLSEKMKDGFLKQRKVKNRPSLKEVEKLLETLSLVKIGEMYGVTDSAIRKWIKQYRKKDNTAGE